MKHKVTDMCYSGEITDWQKGKFQTGMQYLNIEILQNQF